MFRPFVTDRCAHHPLGWRISRVTAPDVACAGMTFFWKELLRRLFHDLRMAMVSDKAVGVLVKRLIDATQRAPRRLRGRTKPAEDGHTDRHEAEAVGSAGNAGWLEPRTGYATCLSLSAANRFDDDGALFLFSARACPAPQDAPHASAGSPVPLKATVELGAWRITTRVADSEESEPGGDLKKDGLASTPVLGSVDELFAGRFGSVCRAPLFVPKRLSHTRARASLGIGSTFPRRMSNSTAKERARSSSPTTTRAFHVPCACSTRSLRAPTGARGLITTRGFAGFCR